jgi:4-amino-4-deoxy-L-arabinose transferase-like glycosyltransferase
MAGHQRNFKWAGSLGLLLGLALWAKQSAVMFIPGIVLMIVAFAAQKQIPWLKALEYLGVALGLAGLVFLPRALWNLQTYGTFTPEFTILVPIPWPSLIHGLASTLHQVVKTFWATSGVTNNVGYPFPLAGMALMALCLLAQQEEVRLQRREPPAKLGPSGTMMGVLFVTLLVAVFLVLRFGYLSTMGQGRHLFPVLLPIGLMLAAGLRSLPLKRPELQATGFWVAYAVTFLAFSLSRFPAGVAGQ